VLVSTHSRPKAAARQKCTHGGGCLCFNTQLPEGGCVYKVLSIRFWFNRFNTQLPEGGCAVY